MTQVKQIYTDKIGENQSHQRHLCSMNKVQNFQANFSEVTISGLFC